MMSCMTAEDASRVNGDSSSGRGKDVVSHVKARRLGACS